jgi:hypothetical protein
MRNLALYFLLAAYAAGPGSASAGFVIKLKNGNEFVTGRFWHEGRQVMFDTYGGIFGIDKSFVITIEESDKPIRLAVTDQKNTQNESQVDVTNQKPERSKPATSAEAKTEAKRDADDPILKEFNRLKEKSAHIDGMLTSEIRELLKEITGFKNMLSRNSKYFVDYAREFNEAQEIGNVTETALRSRDQ